MILVAGESLIDLIVGPQRTVYLSPGGGPFNAARTMARLGQPVQFLGRFSGDPLGHLLADALRQDQVQVMSAELVPEPTTLASVAVDALGVPQYWFYLAGTAGFLMDGPAAERALATGVTALHIGALGLVVEPMASDVERLVARLPAAVLLLLDPNCRPSAITDADGYRDRLRRILPRTDVVKTSAEDLAFLLPETGLTEAARAVLGWGAGCVLVTDGPASIHVVTRAAQLTVPVPAVTVVDTVGAGDAFGGGFLAWWQEHGLQREHLADAGLLRAAVTAGAAVSSLTCRRAGAEPPWRRELAASPEWDLLSA